MGAHGRASALLSATSTSFAQCPNDPKPMPVDTPAPAFGDSNLLPSTPEEFEQLHKFGKIVDASVEDALKEVTKYRHIFERWVEFISERSVA